MCITFAFFFCVFLSPFSSFASFSSLSDLLFLVTLLVLAESPFPFPLFPPSCHLPVTIRLNCVTLQPNLSAHLSWPTVDPVTCLCKTKYSQAAIILSLCVRPTFQFSALRRCSSITISSPDTLACLLSCSLDATVAGMSVSSPNHLCSFLLCIVCSVTDKRT